MKSQITPKEATLVRKVLATTGYAAPMHERHEARRIVDRVFPPMHDSRSASLRNEGDNC